MDDFVILHHSKNQLEQWKKQIEVFLQEELKLALHPQKSRIIPVSKGVDFVGFRNLRYRKLLRKRNVRAMRKKIELYKKSIIDFNTLKESYQGWQAYARGGTTHKLRESIKKEIIEALWNKL